jgi:glutamate racemase
MQAILGCTHYPLLEDIFAKALGGNVKVFSQPRVVADSLADYLERRPDMIGDAKGAQLFDHRVTPATCIKPRNSIYEARHHL